MNTTVKLGMLAITVAGLAGCAAPRLPPDARGVSFPAPETSYRKDGIVVAPDTAALLRPGISKDQVRQLLGNPHFSEGIFSVTDWNYRVDFPRPEGALQCQLQLQFENGAVKDVYWQSEPCTAMASAVGTAAPTLAAPLAPPETEILSLTGLLFPFGRSAPEDLGPQDRERLESFAKRLAARSGQLHSITVSGHADRIGSAERKYRRSLERARTVADLLARQGIDPRLIRVVGRGDADAASACDEELSGTVLKECLEPDRGVVVLAEVKPS